LSVCAKEAIKTFKVNDKSGLYAWAFSRSTLVSRLKNKIKMGIAIEKRRKISLLSNHMIKE
jgi:hypothetical protein